MKIFQYKKYEQARAFYKIKSFEMVSEIVLQIFQLNKPDGKMG